jgi:hypothetical protein
LSTAAGAPTSIFPARLRRHLQQSAPGELRHAEPELHVLRDLCLDRRPLSFPRTLFEGAQKDGLADATEPGDEQRLLGVTAAKPVEKNLEGLELGVAPDKSRRPRAGVRRIRVVVRPHCRASLAVLSGLIEIR